jgi:hypothetical protein
MAGLPQPFQRLTLPPSPYENGATPKGETLLPQDWSREEVEATVADYFAMLDQELRGLDYSKTQHRRALSLLVNQRTDAAIERKHQNISAILRELGFPYIFGYKPLPNYQQLLLTPWRSASIRATRSPSSLKSKSAHQLRYQL